MSMFQTFLCCKFGRLNRNHNQLSHRKALLERGWYVFKSPSEFHETSSCCNVVRYASHCQNCNQSLVVCHHFTSPQVTVSTPCCLPEMYFKRGLLPAFNSPVPIYIPGGVRHCEIVSNLLIFRLTSAEQFDASLASSLIADSICDQNEWLEINITILTSVSHVLL